MLMLFDVHPTGVGMIRSANMNGAVRWSSSHRRGNDSVRKMVFHVLAVVHPTGVGMIRQTAEQYGLKRGSSHRRGNDSNRLASWSLMPEFIPQAWE